MIKILFVCHGNICRSPMAEFVMKDLVKKRGVSEKFEIASAATSYEEIGNPVHYGTREKLAGFGISVKGKRARKLLLEDYEKYDYIIGMDSENIRNMLREFSVYDGHKVYKMLDFAGISRDVADPWYTGDFDKTYDDIRLGCEALLEKLINEGELSE